VIVNEQEFEEYLKRGLQSRPTPTADADLAGRAMRMALAGPTVLPDSPQVRRVRMLSRMLATAASLVVVAALAVGGYFAINAMSSSSAETAGEISAEVSTESDSSSNSSESTYIAGALVLAAAGILWGSRGQVVIAGPAKA
jgi:hypothetical protein